MSDTAEQLSQIARVWAELDGCEGGTLLERLADTLDCAHYSYAGERELERLLRQAIEREIEVMEGFATGEDPDAYGYDTECVERALSEISTIRMESHDR